MAAALRVAERLRVVTGSPSLAFTRSAFVARRSNYDQPNWFGVALAFGTSAAMWAFLCIAWLFIMYCHFIAFQTA